MSGKPKNPGFAKQMEALRASKEAAAAFNPETYLDESPSFRFALVDLEQTFSLSFFHVTKDHLYRIRSRLAGFEGQTWREIDTRKSCHPWDPAGLNTLAASRAEELRLLELYQLDFGKKGRLFGTRSGAVFSIVWWDPDHEGYTTKKKLRSQT